MRIGAAQLDSWRARLATSDRDVASELVEAVEPLRHLPRHVALGRRRLAARHAAAVERRISASSTARAQDRAQDESAARALVARLRKLAGE